MSMAVVGGFAAGVIGGGMVEGGLGVKARQDPSFGSVTRAAVAPFVGAAAGGALTTLAAGAILFGKFKSSEVLVKAATFAFGAGAGVGVGMFGAAGVQGSLAGLDLIRGNRKIT